MRKKVVTTLCLVREQDRILLGMKKRGFGAGRWNGFGGKLHKGESIEDNAKRELEEEACIVAEVFDKRGILEFVFENGDYVEVHVFSVAVYKGEPKETEEMAPKFFSIRQIPYDHMWPDDKYWLPKFLENKYFKGRFNFHDMNTITDYWLEEVKSLS